jgi:hypothetical protein
MELRSRKTVALRSAQVSTGFSSRGQKASEFSSPDQPNKAAEGRLEQVHKKGLKPALLSAI